MSGSGALTNPASLLDLTNLANSKQFGTLTLTNLDGTLAATNILGSGGTLTVTSNSSRTVWTITSVAAHGSEVTNLANSKQFGTLTLSNLSGSGALTNVVNAGLSNLFATNITVRSGSSSSNAFVGGIIHYSVASHTNLTTVGTAFTNLANVSIASHTLTNNGDTLYAEWGGVLMNAAPGTNNFQLAWGGTVFLDTGLQISSNTTFNASCKIIRTGTSAQHVEGWFEWGPGGAVPFAFTNVNVEMTINAGIAQTLGMLGAARRAGSHTNNSFTVEFKPGPK